jgi:putative mRNA 3-end processing factor
MKFTFHGAAGEVGRSCIELSFSANEQDRRILFDAGFKVRGDGALHPTPVNNIENLDAVFVSHAHLDHIGSLPYFDHIGMTCPLFMTGMTKDLAKIMLEDSFHIELMRHNHPAYTNIDVKKVFSQTQAMQYYHLMKYKDFEFEFIPAGHIPGSAMILLAGDGKTVLYTGDIHSEDSHLIHKVQTDFLKRHTVDVMIAESTYGNREHPSRKGEEQKILNTVKKALKNNGSILFPAFSIGRAQELLMILDKIECNVPIYLDGMAKRVTDQFIKKELHIRNADMLNKALEKVTYVTTPKQRREVLHKQSIVVTTSGMISGGPVMEYMKHFWHNKNNVIILTGYQAPGTNGRMLLDEGHAYIDGQRIPFIANVKQFDLSGHAGKKGILALIKKVSPKLLILNHGDPEAIAELAACAKGLAGEIKTPVLGESIIY